MSVLIIATLDTKGVETTFVRDRLRAAGVACLVLDAGALGPPTFAPATPRESVFAAAGTSSEAVRAAGDRGKAVAAAAKGRPPSPDDCTPRAGCPACWVLVARRGRRSEPPPCASCPLAC